MARPLRVEYTTVSTPGRVGSEGGQGQRVGSDLHLPLNRFGFFTGHPPSLASPCGIGTRKHLNGEWR